MIKKYFTCKHVFTGHSPNDARAVIRLGNDYNIHTEPGETFIACEAADRLYDYEQLGYTPEELRKIIEGYYRQKIMMNSVYGSCSPIKQDEKPAFHRDIHAIIDTGMKKRDRSVSITFTSMGTTVDITPYPEVEEEES